MKNLIIIKCLVTVLVMFMSCNSNILDYDDPNNYDTRTYFKTPEEIQKAAKANYS